MALVKDLIPIIFAIAGYSPIIFVIWRTIKDYINHHKIFIEDQLNGLISIILCTFITDVVIYIYNLIVYTNIMLF